MPALTLRCFGLYRPNIGDLLRLAVWVRFEAIWRCKPATFAFVNCGGSQQHGRMPITTTCDASSYPPRCRAGTPTSRSHLSRIATEGVEACSPAHREHASHNWNGSARAMIATGGPITEVQHRLGRANSHNAAGVFATVQKITSTADRLVRRGARGECAFCVHSDIIGEVR
jgi:hypothetical protein